MFMRFIPFGRLIALSVSLVTVCQSLFGQIYLNEIMASNSNVILDPDYGDYADWFELYNSGSVDVTVGGYYLSDDPVYPQKWKIPAGTVIKAKSYLLIWADEQNTGLHTNFKLSSGGEQLTLYTPSGDVVDQVSFPEQIMDVSYAQNPQGSGNWVLQTDVTPGAKNATQSILGEAPKPTFSVAAGFYEDAQVVSISTNLVGGIIRYTLDGSDPNETSPVYLSPVTVEPIVRQRQYAEVDGTGDVTCRARTLKAKVFHDNYVPSNTVGNTYFIGVKDYTLPVISISTDQEHFFSDETGIYVTGTNGTDGPGNFGPKNYFQDWERPVYFEFFDKDKERKVNQMCGAKVMGAYSRHWDMKSLSIIARNEYGKDKIKCKFFKDRDFDEFQSIILRNSGNDFNDNPPTMIRDVLSHKVVDGQMDLDIQAYQPAIVYLNGEYWGIMNIRERLNEHYVANNNPEVDPDNVDYIKFGGTDAETGIVYDYLTVKEGDINHFQTMYEFISNNDMSVQANYEQVKQMLNINRYMNYNIAQMYVSNRDWPGNNCRMYRSRAAGGKWNSIYFDTDFGWGIWSSSPYRDDIDFATTMSGENWPNPPWSTLMLRKLLDNAEFKQEMGNRFVTHINGTYNPSRVEAILAELKSGIKFEMRDHVMRWKDSDISKWYGFDYDDNSWTDACNSMVSWSNDRNPYMLDLVHDYFGFGTAVSVNLSSIGSGSIMVNEVPFEGAVEGAFFEGMNLNLVAQPKPGYEFVEWMRITGDPESVELIPFESNWKYNDSGNDLGATWTATSYNDGSWASGNARLGYSDDAATELSYGSDDSDKHPAYFFRKTFTLSSDPSEYKNLFLEVVRDDGAVVYINGQEVFRTNMPEGEITYTTFAANGVNDGDETIPYTAYVDPSVLVSGTNVIAVSVHQVNSTSTDVGFDLRLSGQVGLPEGITLSTDPKMSELLGADFEATAVFDKKAAISKVYINEVMASNSTIIADEAGEFNDWIELYNPGTSPVDVGGCYITDSLQYKTQYLIPTGYPELTTIPAKGYLILWADGDTDQGPLHLPFKLSSAGDQVGLYSPSGSDLVTLDEVTFSAQSTDLAYGRFPDGDENMLYLIATPEGSNKMMADISGIYINEYMASNNGTYFDENGEADDWIEIYNSNSKEVDIAGLYISDDPLNLEKYRIPANDQAKTTIPAGGYLILWADKQKEQGVLHLDISLSSLGESIILSQSTAGGTSVIDQVDFTEQVQDVSVGRLPDGSTTWSSFPVATPNAANQLFSASPISGLYINEVLSNNVASIADNRGEFDDWVEFYNSTSSPIDLGGMFVTDSLENPFKFMIPKNKPDSTTVPAGGYLVLWADDDEKQGVRHLGFNLSADGDEFGLFQPDGTGAAVVDSFSFGSQYSDISYGRFGDGAETFSPLSATFESSNKKLNEGAVICNIHIGLDTLQYLLTPLQTKYDIVLPKGTASIPHIQAIPFYQTVNVTVAQPEVIINGVGKVTASTENGTVIYTLNFTKELFTDATLSALSVSDGDLVPVFSPENLHYTVVLDGNTITSIPLISAEVNNTSAHASITQASNVPGSGFVSITAEDGTQKVYSIAFEMPEFDIIEKGDRWKYYDQGEADADWKTTVYDDALWGEGRAPLGYGDDFIETTIGYGGNDYSKYPTSYYRKTVAISDLESIESLTMFLRRDDGAIVYVNGVEVIRSNMREAVTPGFDSLALGGADDEFMYYEYVLDKSLLVEGTNVFAAEVHQSSITSTDACFDFELSAVRNLQGALVTQELIVSSKLQLFSLNVHPESDLIEDIFAEHLDKIEYIESFDGRFEPGVADNTLTRLKDGYGYYIQLKPDMAFNLNITGTALYGPEVSIYLNKGWNIVGYPCQSNQPVSNAFVDIISGVETIKTRDQFYNNIEGQSPIFNELKTMSIGKAYLVKMKNSTTFSFPVY